MMRPMHDIVGRDAELQAVAAFISQRDRLPAALLLKGDPGVGKTTLWSAAAEEGARAGYQVLSCRPAGAEVRLSHAALTDLLGGSLDRLLPALPAPQRRALEVALLITDDGGRALDRRAVAAGVLSALRILSAEQPVLIAVDDAQWLDPPSAQALEFALRRLTVEPVAVLLSSRLPGVGAAETDHAMGMARVTRVEVGPLSLGALHRLLVEHRGHSFSRPTLRRIFETSGGNPFYAIELARATDAGDETAPGVPMRLPDTLEGLLAERLTTLPTTTRRALVVAAAASEPTIPLLDAVTGSDSRRSLRAAIEAGLVRLEGSHLRWTHPLFAAAAYALPGVDRSGIHARLAELSSELEERARHRALASDGPDPEVAGMLIDAAEEARARGASATAAELMEAAILRTPPAETQLRAERVANAAQALIMVGERRRARLLLESALPTVEQGGLRADLLTSLSELVKDEADGGRHERELLEEAIDNAGDDARRHARALLKLEMLERHAERFTVALPMAREALALAKQTDDETLLTEALTRTADLEVLTGTGGDPTVRFAPAIELDARLHVDPADGPVSMLAVCLVRAGRLDEARPLLLRQRQRTLDEGDESSRDLICLFLAELEWLAGNWDDALERGAEGLEVAEQTGSEVMRAALAVPLALVAGARGDVDGAIEMVSDAAARADAIDERSYATYNRQAQGFLELTRGNAQAATRLLLAHAEHGLEGTKRIAFGGDEIEALIQVGDRERAAEMIDELEARGRLLQRPPLIAIAARGRALLAGARGEEPDENALESCVETLTALGLPFERARTLLVLGEVRRRAKRKRAAREALEEAITGFERLGAVPWMDRARHELARIGGRTRTGELTATELRVAELVAAGQSNKEVAAELFVSVRAVEANLSRIYAKLGIESRTQLARHWTESRMR